jgi:hypothetical protein
MSVLSIEVMSDSIAVARAMPLDAASSLTGLHSTTVSADPDPVACVGPRRS